MRKGSRRPAGSDSGLSEAGVLRSGSGGIVGGKNAAFVDAAARCASSWKTGTASRPRVRVTANPPGREEAWPSAGGEARRIT